MPKPAITHAQTSQKPARIPPKLTHTHQNPPEKGIREKGRPERSHPPRKKKATQEKTYHFHREEVQKAERERKKVHILIALLAI
jgi:hypothetical protein